ncbi:MAG: hypothetical protein U0324_01455 [Polyangiales bacterium]
MYAALGWLAIVVVAGAGWAVARRVQRTSERLLKDAHAESYERAASLVRSLLAVEPLLRTGLPTRGRIVAVEETGVTFLDEDNDVVRVTVELMAAGLRGGAPYTAECLMWILADDRPRFEPGTVHDVRVDPQDPTRIALAGTPFEALRELARGSAWGDRV